MATKNHYLIIIFMIIQIITIVYATEQTFTINQAFTTSLSNNLSTVINYVAVGFDNNIYVIFSDRRIRKYNSQLTGMEAFSLGITKNLANIQFFETINKTWSHVSYISQQISVTKDQNITDRKISMMSSDRKTIYILNYSTPLILVQTKTYSISIIHHHIFPFYFTPRGHLLIQTIIFQNKIISYFSILSQTIISFNSNITQALTHSSSFSSNSSTVIANSCYYFAGHKNGSLIKYGIEVSLSYLINTNLFNMYNKVNSTIIYNHTSEINILFKWQNLIITQDQNKIVKAYDTFWKHIVVVDSIFQTKSILSIFTKNVSNYFTYNGLSIPFVYDQNLFRVNFTEPCGFFNNLAYNFFLSSSLNFAYRNNSPYLFKISSCQGQFFQDGLNCASYTCLVNNCISCNLSPLICDVCANGYNRSQSLIQCQFISQNNTNTTNGTGSNSTDINITNCSINNCKICSSVRKCQTCQDNFMLIENQCIVVDSLLRILNCQFLQISAQIQKCKSYINNDIAYYSMTINKYLLKTPFLMQAVTLLSPLLLFNNDYLYYIYHNRTYSDLFLTNIFLQVINAINNQRLFPFFIDQSNQVQKVFIQSLDNTFQSNFSGYTYNRVLLIDQNQTYFISNIHPMILWNFTFTIFILLILKIIKMIIEKKQKMLLKQKKQYKLTHTKLIQIIIRIRKYLAENVTFAKLIIALIQSNSIFIAFYAGLQYSILFQFRHNDKINNILSIVFFFICLFVACTFYLQIYFLKIKYRSKIIEEKHNVFNSYVHQNFVMGLRNTAYGFFQAILITDYTSMISLIIIIRISIFISFIYFRKCYKFKSELVLKLSYVGFGIFYDLILGITYLNFQQITSFMNDYGYIMELIALSGIVFSTILLILFYLIKIVFKAVRYLCHNKNDKIDLIAKQQRNAPIIIVSETNTKIANIHNLIQQQKKRQKKNRKVKKVKSSLKNNLSIHNTINFQHQNLETPNLMLDKEQKLNTNNNLNGFKDLKMGQYLVPLQKKNNILISNGKDKIRQQNMKRQNKNTLKKFEEIFPQNNQIFQANRYKIAVFQAKTD